MMRNTNGLVPLWLLPSLLLSACQNPDGPSGVNADTAEKFDAIGADETLNFTGTEPFWGGEVSGETLTYTTPEDAEGQTITVTRFAGLNGLGLNGTLNGDPFDMAVSPGPCSDGMSDSTYPFNVIIKIADDTREGCGWTKRTPIVGENGA